MNVIWRQPLGLAHCPYLVRWVVDFVYFALRLHCWLGSDDQRAHHDHGWWFFTFVFWGEYLDCSPQGVRRMRAPAWAFWPATHQHTVKVVKKPTWSIMITGREKRVWGFWVNGKFRKRNKYFFEHGHHPCET